MLNGPFDVAITWGAPTGGSGVSNTARIEVNHADGADEFFVDMGATNNEWVFLDSFNFTGAAGEYIRIYNNGEPVSLSGNVQYDSVRLTLVPEPSSIALGLLGGLGLLVGYIRRRR